MAISNSMGLGGHNGAVVLRRVSSGGSAAVSLPPTSRPTGPGVHVRPAPRGHPEPRDLALMLGALVLAMLVTSPSPPTSGVPPP